MANRSRQTFIKRQKERARMEKARQKAEKRASRKDDRTDRSLGGPDMDLMGIVPGPQPVPWETEDLLTPQEKLELVAEKEAEAKAKEKAAKEAAERA